MAAYVLGRRPDEFGLVPDRHGFVKTKTFLKALHEEPGWGRIRQGDINELLVSLSDAPVELDAERIRAVEGSGESGHLEPAPELPPLLYTCVRRRAYPRVHRHGISPSHDPHVVLARDEAMARRIGQRSDSQPVVLTVQTREAVSRGTQFLSAGRLLFCADYIPAGTFTGPPLPKEAADEFERTRKPVRASDPQPAPPPAGSFWLDPGVDPEARRAEKNQRRKQRAERQKQRRRDRRRKEYGQW